MDEKRFRKLSRITNTERLYKEMDKIMRDQRYPTYGYFESPHGIVKVNGDNIQLVTSAENVTLSDFSTSNAGYIDVNFQNNNQVSKTHKPTLLYSILLGLAKPFRLLYVTELKND
jgi:hypothetical protein